MSLFTVILALVIIGVLLYFINVYVPMDGKVKKILNWVVVIFIIVWLCHVFGLFDELRKIHL